MNVAGLRPAPRWGCEPQTPNRARIPRWPAAGGALGSNTRLPFEVADEGNVLLRLLQEMLGVG